MTPRTPPGWPLLLACLLTLGCSSQVTTDTRVRVKRSASSDESEGQKDRPLAESSIDPAIQEPEDFVGKAEAAEQARRGLEKVAFDRWIGTGPLDPRDISNILSATDSIKALPPLEKPELPEGEKPLIAEGHSYGMLAENAARAGRFDLAYPLYCASFIADESDGREKIRYSDFLQRPVWRLRFGVSVSIHGHSQYGPQPVRETGESSSQRVLVGPPPRSVEGSASKTEGSSTKSEGSSSKEVVSRGGVQLGLRPRRHRGLHTTQGPSTGSKTVDDVYDEPIYDDSFAGSDRSFLNPTSGAPNKLLNDNLGLAAKIVGEVIAANAAAGNYGPLTGAAMQRQFGAVDAVSKGSPAAALLEAALEGPSFWYPDIRLIDPARLGVEEEQTVDEKSAEIAGLLKGARMSPVDILIHFDVYLKESQRTTRNLSRCRVFDVATKQVLAVSKGIENRAAEQFVDEFGRADTYAYTAGQLKPVLQVLRKLQVRTVPELTAEVAKQQIVAVLAEPDSASLPTIALIDLYRKMELITEEEADHACQMAGGEPAMRIRHLPGDRHLIAEWVLQH